MSLVNQHHADQIDLDDTPLEFMLREFPGAPLGATPVLAATTRWCCACHLAYYRALVATACHRWVRYMGAVQERGTG